MIELSPSERRALRAAAHHLQPVVAVAGNGLSPAVLKEIDVSLKAHELIKVKLHGIERDERAALLNEICAALDCAAVQQIGNILVLWRENPEKAAAAAATPRRTAAAPRNKKEAAAALEAPRRRLAKRS
jgi:putative YhbY family RNA-binding protein